MLDPKPLHRLFGLSLIDFFDGTPIAVETELDLSLKQQHVDIVLIRKEPGPITKRLPDGFEELANRNLLTFKSHRESLDGWALWELIGHFVNYRKQASPSWQELIPEDEFRLFAVCARYPRKLAEQTELLQVQAGVYELRGFGLSIRLIVLNELALEEHNAILHLFSSRLEALRYGQQNYRPHSSETSSVIRILFETYSEDETMSDKLKAFVQEANEKWHRELKERMKDMSPQERMEGLPDEERLRGVPDETRVAGVQAAVRLQGLSPDEIVQNVSPEALEAIMRKAEAKRLQTP